MPKLSNLENLEQLIEKNMDKNIKNIVLPFLSPLFIIPNYYGFKHSRVFREDSI
jgi:hypothetical protein